MIFEKIPGGAGKFNLFLVNGKPYPHEREFVLQQGTRYRLVMRNRTDDAHPMHLHRHLWELHRDQRQTDRRRHQGHGRRPLLRPRRRRLHRQPARPLPLPLPHPAAHGLRLQSAFPLQLNPGTGMRRATRPE